MPNAAPRPCRHPGCGALARDGAGRCPKHLEQKQQADKTNQRQHDKDRGSSAQRGYGGRWQKARAAFLRNHPLCVRCGEKGSVVLAEVVDHKVPHRGDSTLFWDASNWQSLCKRCHDVKTTREDGGGWGGRSGRSGKYAP